MRTPWVAAALGCAAVLLATAACSGDAGTPSGAASVSASAEPSSTDPPTADPATLGPTQVLAQAVRELAGRDAGQYTLALTLDGVSTYLVRGAWAVPDQYTLVDVQEYDRTTHRLTAESRAIRLGARTYAEKKQSCFVDVSSALPTTNQGRQIASFFATPAVVLKTLAPGHYDHLTLTLTATMPLQEAALMLGAGDSAQFGDVPLDKLTGTVPATVKFTAEGLLEEVDVDGATVLAKVGGIAGVPKDWTTFLGEKALATYFDGGPIAVQEPAPEDQFAPRAGRGCDTSSQ